MTESPSPAQPERRPGVRPARPRRAPAPDDRQQDADRSRRALLAAALDEFAAKGYAGARVQEIAAKAGVNKQLINYYFDSKAGLYRELQRTWLSRERAFAGPEVPLDELAVRYLREALAEPRLTRLMAWRGLTGDCEPAPGDDAARQGNTAPSACADDDEAVPAGAPEAAAGDRDPDSGHTGPNEGRADSVGSHRSPVAGHGDSVTSHDGSDVGGAGGAASGRSDGLANLSSMSARQATGEVATGLDPASVRLAVMGAVMIPVVMPQLVREIFGLEPADPAFEARYGEHLRKIIRRLGQDAPAQDCGPATG